MSPRRGQAATGEIKDADEHDRGLLDAYDAASGHVVGTKSAGEDAAEREAA